MKRVFISHSHLDKSFAIKTIQLLQNMGVKSSEIYCSSVDGYKGELSREFLDEIKSHLRNDIVVFLLISKNYYSSSYCLNEMGASWILAKKAYQIILHGITKSDLKGVYKSTKAEYLQNGIAWTTIKNEISQELNIKSIKDDAWESSRDDIISSLPYLFPDIDSHSYNKDNIGKSRFNENLYKKKVSSSKVTNHSKDSSLKENYLLDEPIMIKVRAGNFIMGNKEYGEFKSEITKEFFCAKHLVTRKLYHAIFNNEKVNPIEENLPMVNVSWLDAVIFCNKISKQFGLEDYYKIDKYNVEINKKSLGFRLPTEAEWEYTCLKCEIELVRNELINHACYSLNANRQIRAVGESKSKNILGIEDILGNAWEWCIDDYMEYSKSNISVDRIMVKGTKNKTLRGAGFNNSINEISPKQRKMEKYDFSSEDIGIRLFRNK